jgi:hypothetical protein
MASGSKLYWHFREPTDLQLLASLPTHFQYFDQGDDGKGWSTSTSERLKIARTNHFRNT